MKKSGRSIKTPLCKKAEEISKFQYSLLKALINSTGDTIIFALDREYCYTAFNEMHHIEMKKVWSIDIKIGMNLLDCILIPELRESAKQSIDRALNGERFTGIQLQPNFNIYYEFNWNPIFQNKQVVGVAVFIKDITERKQVEEREALVLRSLPLLIYCLETPNNYAATWISENVNRVTGFERDQFLDEIDFWSSRLHPDDRERVLNAFNELQGNDKGAIEYRWQCANGEYRWFLNNFSSFKKPQENKIEFIGVWLDITERKLIEEKLLESEERYRQLVEGSPDAIAVHFNGKFVFVNSAAAKLIGAQSPHELIGSPILDIIHPDSRSQIIERLKLVSEGKEAPLFEEKFVKFDGSVINVEVVGLPYPYQGKIATQVVVRDITERKLLEKKAKEKIRELERFNNLMAGREFKMIDLKKEVNELFVRLGEKKKYRIPK